MSYGCLNAPRPAAGAATHLAQAGWSDTFRDGFGAPHRTPVMVEIHHVMTTECQYTKQHAADPGCAGCQHQSNKEPS